MHEKFLSCASLEHSKHVVKIVVSISGLFLYGNCLCNGLALGCQSNLTGNIYIAAQKRAVNTQCHFVIAENGIKLIKR